MTKHVAVVGAGITGITTAYYLVKAGYRVSVYDQEPHAAMRTSYANGGQVSVSNSETWTTWSNVIKGVKWMFTPDAPLLIRPRLDIHQWKWLAKFLWTTAQGHYESNTRLTVNLGLQARDLYDEICREEGIEHTSFDRADSGILHFYKDQGYWQHAQKITELYRSQGLERQLLSADEVRDTDPALKDLQGVVGATLTASDWTGDIHKFVYNLAHRLHTVYDVTFYYNQQARMDHLIDQFDAVVVSAGVGSADLSAQIKDRLDIYPVKGYSITINNVDPAHLPKVSLLDDQAKIVTSTLGNRFRVAGTAELTGENYDIRRDRIQPLLDWVHENFPKINTHDYSSWACLRPMTPDMMPIVKHSDKNSKVFYNTGHGHLGWTLAPVTANTLVQIIGAKI
jgi:D-amino-acid dehydrogenase